MRTNSMQIKLLILIGVLLTTDMAYGWVKIAATTKGANKPMKTYYIGRFSIAIPNEMHEAQGSRTHKLRRVELVEKTWPNVGNHEKSREIEWTNFLAEIKQLSTSKTKYNVIIKNQNFPGKWAKGVFFHNKTDSKNEGTWKVLLDSGHTAVWLKGTSVLIEKENNNNLMAENISNICSAYQYFDQNQPRPKGNLFHIKHGAISLPYKWQEETYIRYEGHPLDLKLEIEMDMDAKYKRPEHGLMDKVSSVVASGFASAANVSVKKIRSHKREVAGMQGEEVISKIGDKDGKILSFGWEYVGKDDSGEYPTTQIIMESPDSNLDEKLKIWDAILDSMKPMFDRK